MFLQMRGPSEEGHELKYQGGTSWNKLLKLLVGHTAVTEKHVIWESSSVSLGKQLIANVGLVQSWICRCFGFLRKEKNKFWEWKLQDFCVSYMLDRAILDLNIIEIRNQLDWQTVGTTLLSSLVLTWSLQTYLYTSFYKKLNLGPSTKSFLKVSYLYLRT